MAQSRIIDKSGQLCVTKIERRIVEKNRRNHMKILYSKLNSLLPPQTSKEVKTLPDQIDDAIHHIKLVESRLNKLKETKNSLLMDTNPSISTNTRKRLAFERSPQIEINEIGPVIIEVRLITSLDNHFIFYELLRILSEERANVVNANFSTSGDSIFHLLHAEIANSIFGAAKISEKLKRFVNGSSSDVDEAPKEWWKNFEIQLEMLDSI